MRLAWWSVVLALGSSLAAHAQQPYLVRDINQTEDVSIGIEFLGVAATSNAVYFQTWHSLARVGPSTTPVLVKPLGTFPTGLLAIGDTLYFADEDLEGDGLYRSDGTSAGTSFVPNSPADPAWLTDVAGTLFFATLSGTSASELWRSDGSAPGTMRVSTAGGDWLTAAGNRLFYLRSEPATGLELWTSDGTGPGTHIVSDICPGVCDGVDEYEALVAIAGVLYFVADNGTHGREIWRSDGTASGTRMVRDVIPPGTSAQPSNLTAFGNLLLFSTSHQPQALWRTDGTQAGTIALRTGVDVQAIHAADGAAFMRISDQASGQELWRTNGTAAGTVRLTDGCPGDCDFLDYTSSFATVAGGIVFTRAVDDAYELWRSDGSTAGTAPYATFREAYLWPDLRLSGNVYLFANDGVHGDELWRTDGTPGGTVLATDAADSSSFRQPVGSVGERFFFQAYRPDTGQELWTTTGSSASTQLLELAPGPQSGGAGGGVALGGSLLFSGPVGFSLGLWKSDGTATGTQVISSAWPTSDKAAHGGLAYFASGSNPETGELWRSDGTTGGTFLLKEILPGVSGSRPQRFVPLGDGVLFTVAQEQSASHRLWRTDGTVDGTQPITDNACFVHVRVGSRIFMICLEGISDLRLWLTDGTRAGTRAVGGPDVASSANEMTDLEGTLFFSALSPAQRVLWKSDGTAAGTVQVQDGVSGPITESLTSLTASNGLLFFVGITPAAGAELWRSDGTSAGTYLVRDVLPGPASGLTYASDALTAVPGGIVFRGYTPEAGSELWFSDGTEAGTVPYQEIEPGVGSSYPSLMSVAGSRLYFAAHQTPIDTELWAVDFPAAATVSDVRIQETDSGTAAASFPVALTAPALSTVTVGYATVAGSAQAGSDFLSASGTITFPPGSVGPQFVDVAVLGDLLDEPEETFTFQLTSVVGAATADTRAEGVIADDDGPSIAVAGASVVEGAAGTTPALVTATLTTKDGAPAPAPKTLWFTTEAGTAAPGSDFTASTGTLTFPPGTPTGTALPIALGVLGDTLDEPDEAFTVRFLAGGDETVTTPTAAVHIQDDDGIDAATPREIAPGGALRADLAPPSGRATDRDYYVLLQQPHSSYEVVVDETSGDAVPLTLQRVAEDGSTVLQTASATGTGASLSLRWQNTSSTAVTTEHLALSSAPCGTGCGADDRYRLRVYETTLSAPRFNNVNGQGTVVLLQNATGQPISGRLLFWRPQGWLGHDAPFTVPARGGIAINTLAIYPVSGTLTVTHDGPYGGLVGKAVALEPATGFAFDTPLTPRPR